VKRQAKARFAGSTSGQARSLRSLKWPTLLGAACLATFLLAVSLAAAASPVVTAEPATSVRTTTATVNGAVNPEGVELEECEFDYGTTSAYGQSVPCAETTSEIGAGTSPVPVHADLSGLTLGAAYHFSLRAKGEGSSSSSADMAFTLQGPPKLTEWAEGVVLSEARLRAAINPAGMPTTYHLDYGPTSSYGTQTAEASVGEDSSSHLVTRFLQGLAAGSTYHYRFVATNSLGTTEGPDRTFTTYSQFIPDTDCSNQQFRIGPSAALPDCRAYEMVSPIDKNGAGIVELSGLTSRAGYNEAATNGDSITYSSGVAFGAQPGARNANQYIGSRGPGGWSTQSINPPAGRLIREPYASITGSFETPFKLFSSDLQQAWIVDYGQHPLTPDATEGWATVYRRDNANGSYNALAPHVFSSESEYPAIFANEEFAEIQGASQDFKHIAFNESARLTPDAANSIIRQAYVSSPNGLHLVSVLPDGTANPLRSTVGTTRGDSEHYGWFYHAVSADASRIFWSSSTSQFAEGKIYLRENPDDPESTGKDGEGNCIPEAGRACTIAVSEEPAYFWTASEDGSKAFYTEGNINRPEADLFEFDVNSRSRHKVAGMVSGVLGSSDDASFVYFVSTEDLAAGATEGQPNIYLDHDGTMTFVAGLAEAEVGTVFGIPSNVVLSTVDNGLALNHASRVSPDGRHVAFETIKAQGSYDNTDAVTGEPDMEVYLYDANASGESGTLHCVSCNPSGGRPTGQRLQVPYTANPDNPTGLNAAAWISTFPNNLNSPRLLSPDGSRVYFNSYDALVSRDTNGVQDVYQWEAVGAGSCRAGGPGYSEANGGCISLISTGQSPVKSEFVDASTDGRDVFIRTDSSLDPRDPGLADIYDAREGGGFPVTGGTSGCEGEACQTPPAPPNDPTPGSSTYNGPGNVAAVNKHKKQHRKKANRKHGKPKKHSHKRTNHKRRASR
jgi:hypothetical protein